MAIVECGNAGGEIRGDVFVRVSPADSLEVCVESSVERLYGKAIRQQVNQVAEALAASHCKIEVVDSGALPFVIEARLRHALTRFAGQLPSAMQGKGIVPNPRRRRRSRLYVPANTPRFFLNIHLFTADTIVWDLEDAVAESQKDEALVLLQYALKNGLPSSSETAVRVNSEERGEREIELLSSQDVECFVLPKVESAAAIQRAAKILESKHSSALLMPLIESALGLERAFEIASAHPRVSAISLGLEDYCRELGIARQNGAALSWAHGRLINAARAAGIVPLSSVCPEFEDKDALFDYAQQSKAIGYVGVGAIHPSQIQTIHQAFMPSPVELDWARNVVDVFESSQGGAVQLNGKMIDLPIYERAQNILEDAR